MESRPLGGAGYRLGVALHVKSIPRVDNFFSIVQSHSFSHKMVVVGHAESKSNILFVLKAFNHRL